MGIQSIMKNTILANLKYFDSTAKRALELWKNKRAFILHTYYIHNTEFASTIEIQNNSDRPCIIYFL